MESHARIWRISVHQCGVVIAGIASTDELARLIDKMDRRGYRTLAYTRRHHSDGSTTIRATFYRADLKPCS